MRKNAFSVAPDPAGEITVILKRLMGFLGEGMRQGAGDKKGTEMKAE